MTPSLILLPGLMCDRDIWSPLFPELVGTALCRTADYGEADSLSGMAQQVLADAPARFALAGHSMGGRVALEVLRLAPQRVERLALLDTGHLPRATGPAGDEEARARHALLAIARTQGVRAMAMEWVRGMVAPQRLGDANLIESIVAMFERKSADTFERQIRALLQRPDASPVLQSCRVPTLVLCGQLDSWSTPAQHDAIAALLPAHPAVVAIADAGHMAPMERPQAVARAMTAWLATA
jgi:pimeloyl-ACP methyl ester carboxylesterase